MPKIPDAAVIAALNEFYARDPDVCAPFSPQEIDRMRAAVMAALQMACATAE